MKKIVTGIISLLLLISSASAENYENDFELVEGSPSLEQPEEKPFYMAEDLMNFFSVYGGIGQMIIKPEGYNSDKAYTTYNLGTSMTRTMENGFLYGANISGKYSDINGHSLYGAAGEVQLGYHIYVTNFYGILGYQYEKIEDDTYNGFGYGAGVEFRVLKGFALAIEYKKYDMNGDRVDFEERTTEAKFKFIF